MKLVLSFSGSYLFSGPSGLYHLGAGRLHPHRALVVGALALIQLLVALLAAEAVVAGAATIQVAALAVDALELLVVLAAHVVVAPARLVGDGRAGRRHRRCWLSPPAPRLRAAGRPDGAVQLAAAPGQGAPGPPAPDGRGAGAQGPVGGTAAGAPKLRAAGPRAGAGQRQRQRQEAPQRHGGAGREGAGGFRGRPLPGPAGLRGAARAGRAARGSQRRLGNGAIGAQAGGRRAAGGERRQRAVRTDQPARAARAQAARRLRASPRARRASRAATSPPAAAAAARARLSSGGTRSAAPGGGSSGGGVAPSGRILRDKAESRSRGGATGRRAASGEGARSPRGRAGAGRGRGAGSGQARRPRAHRPPDPRPPAPRARAPAGSQGRSGPWPGSGGGERAGPDLTHSPCPAATAGRRRDGRSRRAGEPEPPAGDLRSAGACVRRTRRHALTHPHTREHRAGEGTAGPAGEEGSGGGRRSPPPASALPGARGRRSLSVAPRSRRELLSKLRITREARTPVHSHGEEGPRSRGCEEGASLLEPARSAGPAPLPGPGVRDQSGCWGVCEPCLSLVATLVAEGRGQAHCYRFLN